MNGNHRDDIKIGLKVFIVEKQNQRTDKLTEGVVKKFLQTLKTTHMGLK